MNIFHQPFTSFYQDAQFDWARFEDINPLSGTRKIRLIGKPNKSMKNAHREILYDLTSLRVKMPYATGGLKGSSILKDVASHAGAIHIYMTDISDAFPSVTLEAMSNRLYLLEHGNASLEQVSSLLQRFCMVPEEVGKGLVVGGPASNYLFNLLTAHLIDSRISGLLTDEQLPQGWRYTRYFDDIKVSLPFDLKPMHWAEIRRKIRRVITDAGFEISHKKSRVLDLRKGSVNLNGVGLDIDGRIFLPRSYLRETRRLIDELTRQEASRDNRKVRSVCGRFAHVRQFIGHPNAQLNNTDRMLLDSILKFERTLFD